MLTANEKILLYGELGSGKTLFIKGLAAGFGMLNYNEVSSPSFVLIKEYHIKTVILYHVDLYRIADNDEYFYKDIDELIRSDDLVAIEWAEKLKETAFPHIKIHLEYLNETSRLITITQLH
ncbi:MAG: tRNA (adenosine(37)-N6)-threonylcarbamoyltransferase complex ATPase subunit type 1 TsaE [Candidatus Fischerbacteria bacterium RBG_13_37_8]|uniref:tRNA threonylcarbamoyladenosine biosynthesis protein TsaE n=1 Tax=Candidatus Fischerbacteria bacterium RBG_13_37_8 TaxID=1817863 RepID=A0A1F5VVK7_9BACT|nr:MAG: tRNA (adenosine(37)-N6)-threonylcarbamoyltransferase complex ATPase subunit type 1 TsaE [Candidatus Fischerbacteria bacterium RBG_13_37_8]